MAKITVKLVKSFAGKDKNNKKVVRALGLRKIGQTNTFEKNAAIMGMIKKVSYMLSVTEE